MLNKKSGMVGLTGFSDMRDVTAALNRGKRRTAGIICTPIISKDI